jgi:hypothetical protein
MSPRGHRMISRIHFIYIFKHQQNPEFSMYTRINNACNYNIKTSAQISHSFRFIHHIIFCCFHSLTNIILEKNDNVLFVSIHCKKFKMSSPFFILASVFIYFS